jgi:hypothetical protein
MEGISLLEAMYSLRLFVWDQNWDLWLIGRLLAGFACAILRGVVASDRAGELAAVDNVVE